MNTPSSRPLRSGWTATLRWAGLVGMLVASGCITILGARNYIEREIDRHRDLVKPASVPTVSVVVAKYGLERGEVIGTDNMAIRPVPAEFLPSSAIQPNQFDALAGMRLARALRSGEPLLREALADPVPEPLSARLAPGRRAVTLNADEINSVSGLLRPGDRIDLLLSARDPQAGQGSGDLTRPLLQDVRILATGSQLDGRRPGTGGASAFGTLTVEVSPDQAKELVLAQRGGRLTAMLRGPDDRMSIGSRPLQFADLLGVAKPAPAAVSPAPRPATEMIVGGMGRSAAAAPEPVSPPRAGRLAEQLAGRPPGGSESGFAPSALVGDAGPGPHTSAAPASATAVARGAERSWGSGLPVAAEPHLIR